MSPPIFIFIWKGINFHSVPFQHKTFLFQENWAHHISLQSQILWSTEVPLKILQALGLHSSTSRPRDTRKAVQRNSDTLCCALWQLCNSLPCKRAWWEDTTPKISPKDGCQCQLTGFTIPSSSSRRRRRQMKVTLFAICFLQLFNEQVIYISCVLNMSWALAFDAYWPMQSCLLYC